MYFPSQSQCERIKAIDIVAEALTFHNALDVVHLSRQLVHGLATGNQGQTGGAHDTAAVIIRRLCHSVDLQRCRGKQPTGFPYPSQYPAYGNITQHPGGPRSMTGNICLYERCYS